MPLRFQPTIELVKEARFANASVSHDRGDLQFPVFQSDGELVLQPFQFRFPSDHARLEALHPPPHRLKDAWFGTVHPINRR